jgi:uncharacterized membrane protein YidH (DUF202 family)
MQGRWWEISTRKLQLPASNLKLLFQTIYQVPTMLQKFLLLITIAAALLAAYSMYQFWNKKINPRQSFKHFMLYMALNLASIFVIVFVFGFAIIYFKEFFFKK